MTDAQDLALGMVALKRAMDRIKPAQDTLRAQARDMLGKKERIPAMIGDEVVGTIGKTSPKKVARVDDEQKLLAWMKEHYPEHVEQVGFIEDMPSAITVLALSAPELVHYRTQVSERMVRYLTTLAAEVGEPVGPGGEADVPGITVDTPEGNVTVLLEKGNEYLIEQLFTNGQVSLDGTVRGQIEGAA